MASSNLSHISYGRGSKSPSVPNNTVFAVTSRDDKTAHCYQLFHCSHGGGSGAYSMYNLVHKWKAAKQPTILVMSPLHGGGNDMPIHTSHLIHRLCKNDASFMNRAFTFPLAGAVINPRHIKIS